DPVTFAVQLESGCPSPAKSAPAPARPANLIWLMWLVLGLGVLAVGTVVVLVLLRRSR
ncbi:MAG: hypothetical protein JWO10_304, partial [Microbacteriaceae bacterium]|nr:hypothetical protein [Microbacteriaceae bacterium]